MYKEGYKESALARSTYGEIPASISASACLDCTDCVARCVNGLDIAKKMDRARRFLA
jgi:predicted aldo/keto reductase-like oxidoreductase